MLRDLNLPPEAAQAFGKIMNDAFNKKPNPGKALALLEQFYHGSHSFVPGDPYATAFKEGQRDVFLTIVASIDCYQKAMEKANTTKE